MPSDIQHSAACSDLKVLQIGIRAKLPTLPFTPTLSPAEPSGEPMMKRYLREAHDPDYVSEPIYPEYIPLEDEHEFPAEEQPLPPVDSPTTESPRYVTKSDPEEDPEEYKDDETEDGPVDYPMDEGDNGDDDDGDSSGDDADEDEDDEDEDDEDEEEEEEEHLASADSTIVAPVDEPVFLPEGTKPVIPPPSTDITIRARITIRPQISISLPLEAEVERLLAMTTPSPSPPISLSPPSVGERLVIFPNLSSHPAELYCPPLGSRYEIGGVSTARDYKFGDSLWGLSAWRLMLPRGLRLLDKIESLRLIRSFSPNRDHVYDMEDPSPGTPNTATAAGYSHSDTTSEMSDMQAELLALREQQRRARQPGPEARIPDHQDASGDADSHIQ
ncbi:hypothetical protein Tco_0559193 [Tanacetum coccineum]